MVHWCSPHPTLWYYPRNTNPPTHNHLTISPPLITWHFLWFSLTKYPDKLSPLSSFILSMCLIPLGQFFSHYFHQNGTMVQIDSMIIHPNPSSSSCLWNPHLPTNSHSSSSLVLFIFHHSGSMKLIIIQIPSPHPTVESPTLPLTSDERCPPTCGDTRKIVCPRTRLFLLFLTRWL